MSRDQGMGMGGKGGGYGSTSSNGDGRNPSKQYDSKNKLSPGARKALQNQKNRAIGRISPSTTPTGNVLKGIGVLGFGMPTQITGSIIDRSPMAFGVPKSTKTKSTKTKQTTVDTSRVNDNRGDGRIIGKFPTITGPVKTLDPVETKTLVSPSGAFNYSVGFKKGGMLRQGKPKLAKKGWK